MSAAAELMRRMRDEVLPLCAGPARLAEGGYVEQFSPEGDPIAVPQRARLLARQVQAFAVADELGWAGPARDCARHALDALLSGHVDGVRVIPTVDRQGGARASHFDLYDQAFVLFGLAHGQRLFPDMALEDRALAILAEQRATMAHPDGGFWSDPAHEQPLAANPHMHTLEAALEWMAVSDRPEWAALAGEVADLFESRLTDPTTGALLELFEADWEPLAGERNVVEPGHQAEWAWLLSRWQEAAATQRLDAKIATLSRLSEVEGRSATEDRLYNELDRDLGLRDGRYRLWPQTERAKLRIHMGDGDADRLAAAILPYLDHPVPGLWWEHLGEGGKPFPEPARISSLYHLMGAVKAIGEASGIDLR